MRCHGRRHHLSIQCRGESNDQGLALIDVHERAKHFVLCHLGEELSCQVLTLEVSKSKSRVVGEGGQPDT